jgi:hypothetical protein
MEPSPKKQETDPRYLNQNLEDQEDQEIIRKITAAFERHLRQKNLQMELVEDEIKHVKEVVKKNPSLRVFVKPIEMNMPLEAIQVMFNSFICFLKLIFILI